MGDVERKKRGFGGMSPEKRRAIQSRGGKAAQETGRGHRWTAEEARVAGRKGGLANRREEEDGES